MEFSALKIKNGPILNRKTSAAFADIDSNYCKSYSEKHGNINLDKKLIVLSVHLFKSVKFKVLERRIIIINLLPTHSIHSLSGMKDNRKIRLQIEEIIIKFKEPKNMKPTLLQKVLVLDCRYFSRILRTTVPI